MYIYLLDDSLNILDYIELSHPYITDDLKMLHLKQPNTLIFKFLLNKTVWELEILKKKEDNFLFFKSICKKKNHLRQCITPFLI